MANDTAREGKAPYHLLVPAAIGVYLLIQVGVRWLVNGPPGASYYPFIVFGLLAPPFFVWKFLKESRG